MSGGKGPVIWQGNKAKLLNPNGLEFPNGISFNTYATVALAQAATPTGDELAYVVENRALYLYCDSCAYDADGDLILTTGNGGDTRWELHQKLSRSIGDTGWIDSDNATISALNSTDVRLAISSQAAIGIKGVRHPVPIGNYDLTITGAAGIKFIHMLENLTLASRDTLWDFDSEVPTMIVYWSGTAIVAAPQTEFHGIRDNIWHRYTHFYVGLQYRSGLTFTGSVQTDNNTNPGASETVYNLWSTSGVVQDEDIQATPGTGQWAQTLGSDLTAANAGVFPFFYFNGTFLTTLAAMSDRAPFIHAGANTPPQWNNGGTLTAAITGDYIVYHYFANPMVGGWSVFARPHNAKYTSLAAALAASPTQLNWSNYAELKHIYTATFRVNTGWANSHRCKLVSLRDFRTVAGTPVAATNPTAHSSLSGLELAGAGVTYGHINDTTQTIAGAKTFSSPVSSSSFNATHTDVNSSNITLDGSHSFLTLASTGASIDVSLPAVASVPAGKTYYIYVSSYVYAINIVPSSGQSINGVTGSLAIGSVGASFAISNNGSSWNIINWEQRGYRAISSNVAATDTNFNFIFVGSATLTLPFAQYRPGKVLFIKNNYNGVVTVSGKSGELIDGAASVSLRYKDSLVLMSDNAGWQIIARFYGEPISAIQSADVTGSGNDSTYSDLTGTGVTLTPGRWLLVCDFGGYVPGWNSGTAVMMIGALFKTGTVLVKSKFIGGAVTSAQGATFVSSSFSIVVTVTSSTDYYLRGAFTRYSGTETVTSGPVFKQDMNSILAIPI